MVALLHCFSGHTARAFTETNNLPRPEWIQPAAMAPSDTFNFRKDFTNVPGMLKAILLVAAEGTAQVDLNGARIGESSGRERAAAFDVTSRLGEGRNELTVRPSSPASLPAIGVVLELSTLGGRIHWIVSDTSWRSSPDGKADWNPVRSLGLTSAKRTEDPFDPSRAFDAYNSWQLARAANTATPATGLSVPSGFTAELLRSAQPGEDSWIALAFDPQGRITIAKEKRGLLRFTLGAPAVTNVELINDTLLECRGLLYARDSLYAVANGSRGLFRLHTRDANGRFDESTELLHTGGGTGHGRNHVKLGPDGKLYLIHGDDVELTTHVGESRHEHYAPDQLLGAAWDDSPARQTQRLPLGHLLRTGTDGREWTLLCGGLRNPLDVAFNEEGEIFTYDADNERDIGAPWYHPTRALHLVSGGEYGWRRSTGTWPVFRADTLPAAVDIGVGSPTGIEFGTRSQFPPRYRRALFICDWAYGRIIAVHLQPSGASYTGTSETFVSGRPLNVTDLAFGPDGAMYFTTGGRQTQSGLYRVRYTGPAQSEPSMSATQLAEEKRCAELRALRHKLEALHHPLEPAQVRENLETIWPQLGHADRWIRYAARIALEFQPVVSWRERTLKESEPTPALHALLALARAGTKDDQPALAQRLNDLIVKAASEELRLVALRAYSVSFARHGLPSPAFASAVLAALEPLYPAPSFPLNHELCELLGYLGSTNTTAKTLPLLARAETSEELLRYLYVLRAAKSGWTAERHREFFIALARAEKLQGAREYYRSLQNIRAEAIGALTTAERIALRPLLEATPPTAPAITPALFVKAWTFDELLPSLDKAARGRAYANGRAAFAKVQCAACHRVGTEGGVLGPDLTSVASRFGLRDLLQHILAPSLAIDEKFRQTTFQLRDGDTVTGTVEIEDSDKVMVLPNLLSPQTLTLRTTDIRERRTSELSPMPEGLLNGLTLDEILDLLAFIESGGNEKHPAFRR